MDDQDQRKVAKLEQLRGDVRQGLDSGPGETWDAGVIKRKARTQRALKPAAA